MRLTMILPPVEPTRFPAVATCPYAGCGGEHVQHWQTVVKPLRMALGDSGFVTLNLFAATCTAIAFVLVLFMYKSRRAADERRSVREITAGLGRLLLKFRLMALIVIVPMRSSYSRSDRAISE